MCINNRNTSTVTSCLVHLHPCYVVKIQEGPTQICRPTHACPIIIIK
uniref:Uncharacterized protein n=1 Tax=Arundo donax TaxID=35708 RepID=A0A0A9AXL8_ARUDO